VIGNFLGVAGNNDTENLPAASLRESEVSFQAVVDPYGRGDFFVSVGEDGAELEEGFLTFTALPWGLLAKVGRMRVPFGKINPLHAHVLPWPDEPLPLVNLLGGEEGWVGRRRVHRQALRAPRGDRLRGDARRVQRRIRRAVLDPRDPARGRLPGAPALLSGTSSSPPTWTSASRTGGGPTA
jgi:hypothetical protein